ncbi:PA14 domain-containing protein [Spirosoma agri]|uniref:OmpA family protein n=2 Tax=Spirosoma agri TaxID=1987381 RepID=A0A6M0IQQ1_9BACT|nr:OmpA family protein [Spirosoma agri]
MVLYAKAQPGLKGDYYTGTNFERKILTRVDPELNFHWNRNGPATNMPRSYYSIRWTGKIMAPVTGQYGFFAKVDDGIRVWVGNKKVMDSWQLNDSKNYSGTILLEAGRYYDLRVDYFNAMLGGELELHWKRPDQKKPLIRFSDNSGDLITAQYFRQAAPPVAVEAKPVKPAPIPPPPKPAQPIGKPVRDIAKVTPKPVSPASPVAKPVIVPKPVSETTVIAVTPQPASAPEPQSGLTAGETVVLRNVQFEQSSYSLLPESSIELDKLVAALKTNAQWRIDVAGHTDNVGDPRLNRALSENRAKVVATYLIRHGIAEERIETKGYGGSQPIADNAIETERVKNRRVAITVR